MIVSALYELLRHLPATPKLSERWSIRASFVLRHSSFVLRHFLPGEIILTHSRAVPRSISSRADYRSVFPSPREAEGLPSFCATSALAPIHRDDKATPRVSLLRAADGSPGKAASPATRDRDATPCCRCP